jgi:hypothetical protein
VSWQRQESDAVNRDIVEGGLLAERFGVNAMTPAFEAL